MHLHWPELNYINGTVRGRKKRNFTLTAHSPQRTYWDGLMPQLDLYFYICFTYDYVVTCFQFTITIRLHYRVRCNPKVIQIELTVNDIHEVQRAPAL